MPYLIQSPEQANQEIHELKSGLNTIGREADNSIAVTDMSLSRHHAQFNVNNGQVMLKDLGSLNGTFVKESKISQCELKDGDFVRLGNVVFKFTKTLASQKENPPETEYTNLSIFSRIAPEQARVKLKDLLESETPEHQGTVLKLRQKDAGQRAVDKLRILLEVSDRLSSPEEPSKLLEKILDLLLEIMNVDRAVILMVNSETGQLEQKAVQYQAEIPIEDQFYSKTITNFVHEHGIGILSSDASSDERFNQAASVLQQEIRASMCVPLKPRDKVIGVLYADNLSMRNIYSNEDLEFLAGLANQAAIAIENAELYNKMQSEAVIRSKLELFFPLTVSKKLKEDGNLEIVDTEVTAIFADITGFTQMSSRMEPRQIIEMLNEYFQVMVEDIVFKYEGTLEKYIGDALLAVWGAPYKKDNDAEQAVHAAIAMQKAVCQLNENWIKRGKEPIQIHIGLNTGPVAAGNIGSEKLIQYATIGDTTNVSSRICSAAEADEILIAQSTLDQLRDHTIKTEAIPPVMVKGKEQPLQLHRVLWNI
ncbi:MAG: adenylate/guanylate cyclase domain-containing protein [Coleofasciculaceae cyanobacterium]